MLNRETNSSIYPGGISIKISDKTPIVSTLTTRFASIQVKLLHLHYRMKKIHEDQERLNEQVATTNREQIRGMLPSAYNFINMLISFEHVAELIKNIFETKEIFKNIEIRDIAILNKSKKVAEKWRPVRNKLGGHIDIKITDALCDRHGFRGVFLSDDLECDVSVLNFLLIESAMNSSRKASDILGRDLDMRSSLANEMKFLVDTINKDWYRIYLDFKPMIEMLYNIGKAEKVKNTRPEDRKGLVVGN